MQPLVYYLAAISIFRGKTFSAVCVIFTYFAYSDYLPTRRLIARYRSTYVIRTPAKWEPRNQLLAPNTQIRRLPRRRRPRHLRSPISDRRMASRRSWAPFGPEIAGLQNLREDVGPDSELTKCVVARTILPAGARYPLWPDLVRRVAIGFLLMGTTRDVYMEELVHFLHLPQGKRTTDLAERRRSYTITGSPGCWDAPSRRLRPRAAASARR